MAKDIIYGDKAQQALLRGVTKVKDAVVITLGPKGSNVAIDTDWEEPNIVHDGVTVARDIELEDRYENMGAKLVKKAAAQTNDSAGDGTTTATLLTERILSLGLKYTSAGANGIFLKNGIDKAVDVVIKTLKKNAIPVDGDKDIENIATISAQNAELGKIIAQAIKKVGRDGLVTVEEGNGNTTEVQYTDGMEFDKGYLSQYFITNKDRRTSEIKEPYILITDASISSAQQLVPFLEAFVAGGNKDLLIISDNVDSEALALLVVNTLNKKLRCVAVRAPEFGNSRNDYLEDIAILTGGKVVSTEKGDKLESVTSIGDWCGIADKVIVSSDSTRIVGGHGNPKDIQLHINSLRKGIDTAESGFVRDGMQRRLSKLTGGAAIINVGAASEVEMKDTKERVIDAVSATQAAIDEGIVPGGGVALMSCTGAVKKLADSLIGDEKLGAEIILKALKAPARQLIENSEPEEDPGYIIGTMMTLPQNEGYDVISGKFVNLIDAGIIDPVKVTRLAMQNAASIASMMLSTKALITEKPSKQEEK